MDEALPVLRLTWGIQRRWFRKSHFLALNFQKSCLVMKAHTSQNKTYRKCLSEFRLNHRTATPYHPYTNGKAETSKKIRNILQKIANAMGKGWNSMIPEALWTHWTTIKTLIGQTPHQLIYGKTCHIPIDLEFRSHGAIKRWKMDLQSAGVKRKIQ